MQSLLTRKHVFPDEQTLSADYEIKLIGLQPEFAHPDGDARGQDLLIGCKGRVMDTKAFVEL